MRTDEAMLQDELTALNVCERFSWEDIAGGLPRVALENAELYTNWFIQTVEADVVEARRGNLHSPVKAATDVLRDARDDIRYAVEFGGLTGDSHRHFIRNFFPTMKRLSVGPPLERAEEFLALLKQGVVRVSLGPLSSVRSGFSRDYYEAIGAITATYINYVEVAFDEKERSGQSCEILIDNICRRGLARRFNNDGFNVGGLEVDRSGRVMTDDVVAPKIWVLGTPVEGSRFYTFMLPSPLDSSEVSDTARRCASDLVTVLQSGRSEVVENHGPNFQIARTVDASIKHHGSARYAVSA